MSKPWQIFSLQPLILRCFSRSLEQFFLTVGQNNYRNKIPLSGHFWPRTCYIWRCFFIYRLFWMRIKRIKIKSKLNQNQNQKMLKRWKSNKESDVAFWFNWQNYASLQFKITCHIFHEPTFWPTYLQKLDVVYKCSLRVRLTIK